MQMLETIRASQEGIQPTAPQEGSGQGMHCDKTDRAIGWTSSTERKGGWIEGGRVGMMARETPLAL